jgi:hypothetical protein
LQKKNDLSLFFFFAKSKSFLEFSRKNKICYDFYMCFCQLLNFFEEKKKEKEKIPNASFPFE